MRLREVRRELASVFGARGRPEMTLPVNQDETETKASAADGDATAAGPDLRGDWSNFFLLLLLYTMQGFPLGLTSAIPILLQDKEDGSYQDQVSRSAHGFPPPGSSPPAGP